MVEIPEGSSYYDSGGTLGRRYAGSKKPTGIPTFLWSTMSASAKDKAIREEAAEVASRLIEEERGAEASSSSRRPAGVADNVKDYWERQGNQLVRYHYTPRKEMISPDLTDCPVNSNMLSPSRTTRILPMGSQHITTDVDDWSVKRRRNRKFSFHWIGKRVFELKPASACIRSDNLDKFPCMPTMPYSPQHREKIATHFPVDEEETHALMALVARPVNQKELNSNPEAQKSLDVEWEKLVKKRAWTTESVREWDDVRAEAQRKGKKVHVGKVFETCVEKGSELPKGSPLRKSKGRTVFQGNNVQGENCSAALFSELGSSPATMEAGKVLDAYRSQPGHAGQLADGKQAYTQTTLKGTETWVRLPKNRWPPGWAGKYKDPVVKLRLALCGHPGFWEQHCGRMLKRGRV